MKTLGPRNFDPSFERYILYLERMLTPARYQHSLRVANLLVRSYRGVSEKLVLAGLLHDIAKDLPIEEMVRRLEADAPTWIKEIPEPCRRHEMYLHGPAGAVIARRALGVDDPDVIRGIRYHGGWLYDLGWFARIIHIADFAEPGRDVPEHLEAEHLLSLERLSDAELLVSRWISENFPKMGIPLHPVYKVKVRDLGRHLGY